jgi:hypothetical protein
MQRQPFIGLLVIVSLVLAWVGSIAHAQGVTKPCGIGSSGDACIFDVEALANGVLTVDTRATMAGQRWRAAIALAGAKAIKSGIGSGSATTFTGLVSRPVVAGKKYEVIVFYERPLPSTFPTASTSVLQAPSALTMRARVRHYQSQSAMSDVPLRRRSSRSWSRPMASMLPK